MTDFLTKLIPSRLGAALAVALLAGAAAPGPAPAQPRPADLELDLFYLVRDLQGLEEAGDEARAAFAEELAAFEDRLEAAPEVNGRLWAGLDWLYRQIERAETADDAWRRARSAGHPGPRPDTAADLFRPPGERKPGLVGRVSVGAASDSNPSRLGDGFPVLAEGSFADGTILTGGESDGVGRGGLRLALHPWFDRAGWSAGVEVAGHGALHQDLDFLDRTEGRATVHLALGGDPAGFVTGPLGSTRVPRRNGRFGLLLQVGVARNRLDGERHVGGLEGAGSILFRGGPGWSTRLDLIRSNLKLERPDPTGDLTWEETTAGLIQSFFLGRRDRVLRLGASTGERSGDPEVEGSFLSGHAGLDLVGSGGWALFLELEMRQEEYDQEESNPFFRSQFQASAGRPPRDETIWRASGRLVRELAAGARLSVSVSHEDREAEHPISTLDLNPLTYDRTVTAAGLHWSFGREGTP